MLENSWGGAIPRYPQTPYAKRSVDLPQRGFNEWLKPNSIMEFITNASVFPNADFIP